MRRPDLDQRRQKKSLYKKGHEVRLIANSLTELAEMRRLLVLLGFSPGRSYPKRVQFVQPLYGAEQVKRFLSSVWKFDVSADQTTPVAAGRRRKSLVLWGSFGTMVSDRVPHLTAIIWSD